jgi:hypothetical protein
LARYWRPRPPWAATPAGRNEFDDADVMAFHPLFRAMLLPLLLSTSGQAFANPGACWRYRSELALFYAQRAGEAIDRRQDQRLEQLSGYYRLVGCEQIFLPLGRPPSAAPSHTRSGCWRHFADNRPNALSQRL